jgi:serine protease inhibitor
MQQELTPELNAVVNGNTAFALDLYARLKHVQGNLSFSPYSISTALAMTYAGARGETEQQMSRALRFTVGQEQLHPTFAVLQARLQAVQDKGQIRLGVANSLWPQAGYPRLQAFLALAKQYYGVLITPVNYITAHEQARLEINAWVEQKTENKIQELIQAGVLTTLTRLVLVNAIYFKGDWLSQFDKRFTEEAAFWLTSSDSVMVPMMTQTGEFGYAEDGDLQILELPYAGEDLSMIALLPWAVDGLAQLENALTVERLDRWLGGLLKREVRVSLPRFRLTSEQRLDEPLIAMGMSDAFDELNANFSGMDGRKSREEGLFVSAVIHQAFVEVNEEGTEATAATAVVMTLGSMPTSPPVFRADHPFLLLIIDTATRSILFVGRLAKPVSI